MMPLIECIRKGRASGIATGLCLSAMGPVSRTVLADVNYQFVFRMKDHENLREVDNTLLLPPGAKAILLGLGPGDCLFQGPTWPHATLVRIDANVLPPLRKDIRYDTLPYVPSRSLREMPHVLRALQEAKAAHKAARLIPGQTSKPDMNDPPMQFLSLACDMVAFPAAHIFEAMGNVSSCTQGAVRKELETEGLAVFETWRIERVNRLLQEVTEDGCRLLGKDPKRLAGRGSPAHRNGMEWVRSAGLQRGYRHSVTEFQIGATVADNAYFQDGFRDLRILEIVHACYTNLPDKIRTAFESKLPIEQFIIIAAQKSMLKKIDLFLRAELGMVPYGNRIRFELITPYLEAFLKGRRT